MSTPEDPLFAEEAAETSQDLAPLRRSPRITRDDVFRAADELLLEGNRPTIDRVRMRLGRGSPNTINDHLDAWWTRLGSRLRDLPGREFPQLPERVGQALQHLWNEALEGAHEALRATLEQREQELQGREQALEARARELDQREAAAAGRLAAMEENLALAREQLSAANRTVEGLEAILQERDGELGRLRERITVLEQAREEIQGRLDASTQAHETERAQMQEHYAATERHWLVEVDRSRQALKEATKEHERTLKELKQQADRLQSERDQLRDQLLAAQAEIRIAAAARQQLEERLSAVTDDSARARKFRPRSLETSRRSR